MVRIFNVLPYICDGNCLAQPEKLNHKDLEDRKEATRFLRGLWGLRGSNAIRDEDFEITSWPQSLGSGSRLQTPAARS
jgi:hypothetical protein